MMNKYYTGNVQDTIFRHHDTPLKNRKSTITINDYDMLIQFYTIMNTRHYTHSPKIILMVISRYGPKALDAHNTYVLAPGISITIAPNVYNTGNKDI